MAGPILDRLSLRGMGATESSNSRRDLVVPHTTTQSHDTDGRASQPSNMEERFSCLATRKKQEEQRIRSSDEPAEKETRSFLVLRITHRDIR